MPNSKREKRSRTPGTIITVSSGVFAPENLIPVGGLLPLVKFLQGANDSGIADPRIRFLWDGSRTGRIMLSRTTRTSGYPNAVQVKDGDGEFLGRIEVDGTPDVYRLSGNAQLIDVLSEIAEDIVAAAVKYGLRWANCSFCDTRLTDERSIGVGYGKICAKNWGLPWGA